MSYEYNRSAVFALQIVHKSQYLRLNGNVERSRGFVRDKNFRSARQSHRYHDPLAHTARKLVRVLPRHRFGVGYLHRFEHFYNFGVSLFFLHTPMNDKRLGKLLFYGEYGVQRSHGFLKDNRDFIAPDFIKFVDFEFGKVFALEQNFAGIDITVTVEKAKYAHCGNALTRPRFADYTDRPAGFEFVRYVVYRFDYALTRFEISMKVFYFQ